MRNATRIACQALATFGLSLGLIACLNVVAYAQDNTSTNLVEAVYLGEKDGLSISATDLFGSAGLTLPGDSLAAILTVRNESSVPCDISIKADAANNPSREDAADLLSKVDLTIEDEEGEVLYEGPSGSEDLQQEAFLKSIGAQESETLTFTATLSPFLTNEYALSSGSIPWSLTCKEQVSTSTTQAKTTSYDKTGQSVAAVIAICLALFCLGVCLVRRYHQTRKEDNHD